MKNFLLSETYGMILTTLGWVTLFLGVCALWLWVMFTINNANKPIEVVSTEVAIPEEDTFFIPSEQENLKAVLFENDEPMFNPCDDCPLRPELQGMIISTSIDKGINPAIVYAICESESTFREDIGTEKILGGNENSRYYGYMQLSEYNCIRAEEIYGINAHTEQGNVEYGTILLAELVSKYGELDKVVTAYKAGESVADAGVKLDCCDYIAERVMYWEERLCVE